MDNETTKDLNFEWHYPQSPEDVWTCLTTPELIEKWLMSNDFKLELGHEFKFRSKAMPGWCGIVECKILEIEPLKKLKYTWVSGPEVGFKEVDTTITWQLTPENGGTMLTLDHAGFKGELALLSAGMLEQGWSSSVSRKFENVLAEYSNDKK
ncbi:hypothetical protein BH10BAC5_BH10BAC5_12240 [soil metagenome]